MSQTCPDISKAHTADNPWQPSCAVLMECMPSTLMGVPMHSHSPSPCSLQYNNLGDDAKKAIEKAALTSYTRV